MSRAYDSAGKRISSKTHAKRGHECDFCDSVPFGNGGKVAHGRSHVRRGEAVEMVRHYEYGGMTPSRIFLAVDDTARIAEFTGRGFQAEVSR